jgi:lysophospholipid acyltransferase (LPLAT)-like uncharacterized protein
MTRERLLSGLCVLILRVLFLTIRLKVVDKPLLGENGIRGPVVITFWHNRILAITLAFLRRYPFKLRGGVTVLTSPSKDGEILAGVVRGLGMGAVRGSSSRRGSQALRELVTLIENGSDIAVTPDGPRGPRYKLGPGVISLAQLTGAPLVPMHARFSRCLRLKTWDEFMIPLPFSTISVTVDDMISVPRTLSPDEFEAVRSRVETHLKNAAI